MTFNNPPRLRGIPRLIKEIESLQNAADRQI
jgi:hypothetical protein